METSNERRLRKLTELCEVKGGFAVVAKTAGLKPVYLRQILAKTKLPPKQGDGSRSERALGDPAARAIEEAYDLGRGWFDNDGDDIEMSPKEMQLLGYFRELDAVFQEIVLENVREAVSQRAQLAERMREAVRQPQKSAERPKARAK